jgi:peptidoglycan/LPS O-acetylase OafA/YrhL
MPGIFGLLPVPATLAYYGTFFLGGWWLHARSENLPRLKEFTLPTLTIALIAQGIYAGVSHLKFWPIENLFVLKCVVLFCSAIYAWGMTFAMIGLFLRFCSKVSPRGRYLADASYWCYLAHMPLIIFLQVISGSWRWPAFLKFTLILMITIPILLALYEWRVRYTWVGNMLNGPRKKPEFGCGAATNQETSPAS